MSHMSNNASILSPPSLFTFVVIVSNGVASNTSGHCLHSYPFTFTSL
jgi:hypothetical protein